MRNIVRNINLIVVHCSATKADRSLSVANLAYAHRLRGFNGIGYHFYIRRDGTVIPTRPVEVMGAHAKGFNRNSIGVCYEGGLDIQGLPADTRTCQQRAALKALIEQLQAVHGRCEVKGHRDLSPDLNRNGKVDPCEWIKQCPCFDVGSQL